MQSLTTLKFWKLYAMLPKDIQVRADNAYALWQVNPFAHGLYFKRVGKRRTVYSVRIDDGYRSLGIIESNNIIWFWIGKHDEYERVIKYF